MAVAPDDQTAVFEWLADPASHAERPVTIERIDTHSASVFLAGTRAYKVKRAIRYSFLDFSTVERRREACEAEVRLNRRTAPSLYLGVTPVTRDEAGRFELGGRGEPVEWTVVMRRFPQERLFDRMAQAGPLEPAVLTRLAEAIADFHAGADRTPHRGGVAGMREVIDDNERALASAGNVLPRDEVRDVNSASATGLERLGELLERRRSGGFVRQCHGDLHLRNIVMLDGRPTLFDAIEFNDGFSCIDVWYDTAFLLMDLLARGRESEASIVLNQYLLRTNDVSGLPLLPFFLGCRAAIRAKTSLAAAALESERTRTESLTGRAREYLSLARRVLAPGQARIVAIGGLSGTGKSTLAARLAPLLPPAPGAIVLRSDVLRKLLLHRAPSDRLGPDGYTAPVTEDVYRSMLIRAADLVAEGWPVIVDATFLDEGHRHEIEAVAERSGVPFSGLWLEAPSDQLAERLRQRTADASDADERVLRHQLAGETGALRWTRIVTAGPPDEVIRAARDRLLG